MLATLAAAWILAAPAAAAAAPTPATPPPKPQADPVVCRSETPIGSKLPKKVCVLRTDRERQERESQEALQLIQRRSDGPAVIRDR